MGVTSQIDKPQPLVSVILPVYNGESSVGQTLQSALSQTYQQLEVIVIDDGSSDGTMAILQEFAALDPRVRIITQPNGGVAKARNKGIAVSHGEFIATLDADDLWDPAKIERQVRRMQEAGDATGLVYCWWVWIDANGTILDRSPRWTVAGRVSETLLQVNFTGNASVPMYRRSCLEVVGQYDEDLVRKDAGGCEDWDLALRVAENYGVAVVEELLVGYRRRPGSMSTRGETMWRSQQALTEGARLRRPGVDAAAFEWSNDQFALYLAGTAFWSGDIIGAIKWGFRARTSRLLPLVLPSILRILRKRLVPNWGRPRPVMTPGKSIDIGRIERPLIPYDRIYKRWGNVRPPASPARTDVPATRKIDP